MERGRLGHLTRGNSRALLEATLIAVAGSPQQSAGSATMVYPSTIALAVGLAGAAAMSLALTVLGLVRRRRDEFALLKALGMTRGQVRESSRGRPC